MRVFREFSHEIIQKILSRLGNKDISSVGDGTVTGAINQLDSDIDSMSKDVDKRISNNYQSVTAELESLSDDVDVRIDSAFEQKITVVDNEIILEWL